MKGTRGESSLLAEKVKRLALAATCPTTNHVSTDLSTTVTEAVTSCTEGSSTDVVGVTAHGTVCDKKTNFVPPPLMTVIKTFENVMMDRMLKAIRTMDGP